jgi:hypothetical protein
MAKNSESGHVKNVANFESLISAVNGFGKAYNPSNQSIIKSELIIKAQDAGNSMKLVSNVLGRNSVAIAARTVAFKPLSKLATRILNSMRSSKTSQQVDDSAQSLVHKIQGQRASKKLTDEQKAALLDKGIVKKEISSSQMGFDDRVENFYKLVQLLSGTPEYAPNEVELQVATLTNYYNTLKTANNAVRDLDTELSNARLQRNVILYKPETGLVDKATAAKMYIKSLYGATSPQFKQVSGLAFDSIPADKIPTELFITEQVPV